MRRAKAARGFRGKAAIVGIGLSARWEAPGRSALELLAEAVHVALADAGLELGQVDGLLTGTSMHFMPTLSVAEYLGIKPAFIDGTMIGGSSFVEHLIPATLALDAGLCEVALICYGSNQRTTTGKLVSGAEPQPYEAPYEPRNPIVGYALAAARHMHQYGTTREQLAEVAVAARGWAGLNPEAFTRDALTIADVLQSRMVCDPLSVRDCCLVTDGAGAIIMVSAARAKDFKTKPAYVLGAAAATTHRQISAMPDLTVTAAAQSGPRAMAMAGVKPADIDTLQLYDAFTINTILFLEDLGFCPKGEGGRFVAGGAIAPGGGLAVNTNGGGLSCNHPGMYGIFPIIEAVRQLRGTAADRQVENATLALVHGNGGQLSSQVTAILGTQDTL
ncbi:MAG: thiolase [Proteobacteria bacterium]|nr:thiolase [Pseudomonadota bacterium]MBI3499112.1 thiolase [Pseudomonadota bacterium]